MHAVALQFVRKLSGYRAPSRANEAVFKAAGGREIAASTEKLLASQWAVWSPLPVERLWAKFRRPQAGLRVLSQQLARKPVGLPDLSPEWTVNTFFEISLENSAPHDLFLTSRSKA